VKIAKRPLRVYEVGISYWARTFEREKIRLARWRLRLILPTQIHLTEPRVVRGNR
jgi:hypothetical protein